MTDLYTNEKAAAVNKALSVVPFNPITSLPPLRGDVSINGLTLNHVDANGVIWVVTDITNWWQPAGVDVPDIPRGLDDGSYDVRGRWVARNIDLKGSILVPDSSYVEVARKTLMEAFNLVYTGAWLTVNETVPKVAYVRLNGQIEIQSVNARGRMDFTIPLKSADPLKYDWNTDDTTYGYTTAGLNNLMPNPSFEANTTGWSGNNGTLARNTSIFYSGVASASITTTTAGTVTIASLIGTSAIPITATNTYSASAYVRSAVTPRSATLTIQWYNASGTSVGNTVSSAVTTSNSTWSRLTVTAAVPPTTAAYGRPYVGFAATALSEVHYADAFLFHQLGTAATYFDSSTGSLALNNQGNYKTAMVIDVLGPMTAPCYITNTTTAEVIKIVSDLRASGYSVSTVNNGNIYGGVATLTTSAAHGFLAGDYVSISGSTTGYNQSNVAITEVTSTTITYKSPMALTVSSVSVVSNVATVTTTANHGLTTSDSIYLESGTNPVLNGIYEIDTVPTTTTFTVARTISNTSTTDAVIYKQLTSATVAGTITLLNPDTLSIDTYNSAVSFRGKPDSSRSTLNANTDWIKLQPGNNAFTVRYAAGSPTITAKYRSAWIG